MKNKHTIDMEELRKQLTFLYRQLEGWHDEEKDGILELLEAIQDTIETEGSITFTAYQKE